MPRTFDPEPIREQPLRSPLLAVNAQTWDHLTFLHWRADAEVVQSFLPRGLTVDQHEGETWLGIVPFLMADVRTPPLPALGSTASFPELNARVYVVDHAGNRGVWFLNLWCTSAAFTSLAQLLGLPYRHSQGSVAWSGHLARGDSATQVTNEYEFSRERSLRQELQFSATVVAGEPIAAATRLEHWLTARWNMFAERGGALWRYRVHHEPWALHRAEIASLRMHLPEQFRNIARDEPPLVHMALPVHTRVAAPRLCRRR
ncbi:MAG: DUF2071 domain-containing protein [Microbacteriaceae bacterium]|nr:DUF2071 domain-containing protein [Microbacteriaceae bacterium]